ncbi:MAG: cation:proton antiporter [Rhodospirillaceae bacterium]|nr:cation:proton antiporter [Rhodospirillaceae bacterium]OUT80466.1 MAG: cation:proton antiporter [Rhodospirillaceae bacterium TMED23]|tara:strand:+ start:9913 stop:10329 length:417 start_codon:yes stop_codon:yes gene_type:complete
MKHFSIIRVITKLMIPVILLFALYVQFHGDFGPGGGFQAGVIFASALILYSLIFGIHHARKVISSGATRMLLSVGVILYTGVGIAGIIFGGNFLDYNVLGPNNIAGQHIGILLVELGVGITVAATMITVFFVFAGQDS